MRAQFLGDTRIVRSNSKAKAQLAKAAKCMAAAMLGVFAAGASSSASTVYWDGDGLGAASGGSGIWDTTLQRWASSPGGSTYGTFTNGDTAVFAGTGGTVNFAGNLSGSMDVQSNGYMFFGTSAVTLPTPWTWGGSSTLNVAAGVSAELRSAASGATLTKTGTGTLVFDSSLMTDAATVNLTAGTLQYGRSNFVASMAALATTPNLNSTTKLTMSAGTTLDLRHFHDALGSLNGSGTVVLGRQFYSPGLTLTTPSYTYGSTLLINGGNVSATGTATQVSDFSGNIVSDGPVNPALPFSGGHLVIGTITAPTSGAGLQATVTLGGTNTFHGVTTINGGATLYVKNGNALPDDGPVYLIGNSVWAPLLELQNDEAIGSLGAAGGTTLPALVNPNGHTLTLGGDNLNNDFSAGTAGASIGGIGAYAGPDLGGTIVKVGTGNQIIWTHQVGTTQQSAYTGKYVIKGGLLTFPNDKAVGAIPGGFIANYFTLDGGTLAQGYSQSATTVWNGNRGITVTDNGGGLYGQVTNNGALTWDWQAPIASGGTGIGALTKSGSAALRLLGADNSSFTGKWNITDGALIAGAGYGATVGLGDKPLGTASVDLGGAMLQATSDFVNTSTDQTMNIASSGTFAYDSGATLRLKKGNDATTPTPNFNNSLTVTVGAPASAAGTAFARKAGGSGALLLLADSGQTTLGTATGEKLLVNGGVNTEPVNTSDTIVPTVIISSNNNPPTGTFSGNVSSSEGYFATYDNTVGFKVATMSTKTDINTATSADLYAAVAGSTNTLSADASVYGVKIGTGAVTTDLDLNGKVLNVGGAVTSSPATVIMGMGTNIKATGGGTLAFGAHEAILYNELPGGATPPAVSTLSGTITGSGGFTKMGYGTLNLDASAVLNYFGATRINQGQIAINADNQLPVGTDLILAGVDPSNNFGRAPTLFLNNHTVTVNSLNSVNEKNYNSAANAATIYLGTTGVLKITGSGNSNFDGLIASTASNSLATSAGTSSTVWMAGSGTFKLGMGGRTLNTHFLETLNNYNKLWISNGGTVVVAGVATFGNTSSALPLAATSIPTIASDAYMLDNGTLRFEGVGGAISGGGVIGSGTGNFPITATINANRGLTVGSGGGTIDVANPYVTVALTGVNGTFSGSGTLTKTGPGILALSGPSIVASQVTTAHWKLAVKQGTVTLVSATTSATDDNIGLPPVVFDPTNITLDGGTIDCSANGTYTFNPNRGFFIGSNGGAFGTGRGNLTINGPLSGAGTLTFGGSTTVAAYTFNGSSDGTFTGATQAFTGDVVLARSGVVYANAKNALGIGTIRNDATWPVGLGTNLTTASVQLDNPIQINAGSPFDFITNGAATDMVLTGQISGGGNLSKGLNATFPSAGTLELNNSTNNFTGAINVMQGTLIPRVDGSLSTIAAPLNVLSSGTLAFKGNVNYTQAKPVFVSGTGGIQNISDSNSFAGPITLLGPATIKTTAGSLALSGGITGAADSTLTTSGVGALTVKNIRTGGLNVTAGVTQIAPQANPTNVTSFAGTSKVGGLTIASGAKLDLTNNKLITSSQVGTWDGVSAYTGVTGLIQSGRNGGGWGGTTGIITSQTQAITSNLTTIGVATAAQVKGIAATATATWAGQSVTGSDSLVMYTYGGDANLDGKINVDDYTRIDFNVPLGASGWYNGDFNYDGKINVDDYTIIDFNVGIQGAAFSAAGGVGGLGGVSAVPEPTSLSLISLGALTAASRRRRRR